MIAAVASEPATRFSKQARERERYSNLPVPNPPPLPKPQPPERPLVLRVSHRAVRGVVVELACQHLIGQDVPAVTRRGWLPDNDTVFKLSAERARHEELITEVEQREHYLQKTLKPELAAERKKRVAAMSEGDGKQRPMPDADKLIAQAEDRLLAAQVALVAYCDQTLGQIRAKIRGAWGRERRMYDHQNAERLARAKAELAAATKQVERTFALGQWCDRAVSDLQPSIPWEQVKGAKPPGPMRSVYDQPVSPTRA